MLLETTDVAQLERVAVNAIQVLATLKQCSNTPFGTCSGIVGLERCIASWTERTFIRHSLEHLLRNCNPELICLPCGCCVPIRVPFAEPPPGACSLAMNAR